MQLGHSVHLDGEKVVLLGLARGRALRDHLMNFSDKESSSRSQCPFDVVRVEESLDACSSTWGAQKLVRLGQVGEEVDNLFALLEPISLLEDHTRRLLVHDHIDTFVGRERRHIVPGISNAGGK